MSTIQAENSEEFNEYPEKSPKEEYIFLVLKLLFFFIGIFVTFLAYFLFFEDFAFTELLRGFSIETFQKSLFPFDLPNFILTNIIWFYYIGLFILLVLVPRMLRDLNVESKIREQRYFETATSSFREGALYIPLITTIAFSVLLQAILPSLIIIVVFIELLLPIIILSELAFVSKKYIIKFYRELKVNGLLTNDIFILINIIGLFIFFPTMDNLSNIIPNPEFLTIYIPNTDISLILVLMLLFEVLLFSILVYNMVYGKKNTIKYLLISLISFPFIVYVFVETDLTKFLTLIDYNLLWENPGSQIALSLWGVINNFISFISFNIDLIFEILTRIKYYLVAFCILVIVASVYYYSKKYFFLVLKQFSERVLYKY